MKRMQCVLLLALSTVFLTAGTCGGGSGSGGGGKSKDSKNRSTVKIESNAGEDGCMPLASQFPPGFDLVPGNPDRALLAQFTPPSAIPVNLETRPPRFAVDSITTLPVDSDGDGLGDEDASTSTFGFPLSPLVDGVSVPGPDLGLMTATNYEEVVFLDPLTGELQEVDLQMPGDGPNFTAADYPFLSGAGSLGKRTAVSTRACIRAPGMTDSQGGSLPFQCAGAEPSFYSNFTAGATWIHQRLFVVTSNFKKVGGQPIAFPGTLLVYDLDASGSSPKVGPHANRPYLFLSGYNATSVTPYRSPGGRDFVLVGLTGLIRLGVGLEIALTESAIDIVDAESLELIATIPMGLAALSFDSLGIDPTGRIAMTGSAAVRNVYAVDLKEIDDIASAHQPGDPPVLLDGSGSYRDARIFFADDPFVIPPRDSEGAPAEECAGRTQNVDFNWAGTKAVTTDFCDGTLAVIGVDVAAAPVLPDRSSSQGIFDLLSLTPVVAAVRPESVSESRGLGMIRVREGEPGVDYEGPDLVYTVSLPEGELCTARLDSF